MTQGQQRGIRTVYADYFALSPDITKPTALAFFAAIRQIAKTFPQAQRLQITEVADANLKALFEQAGFRQAGQLLVGFKSPEKTHYYSLDIFEIGVS